MHAALLIATALAAATNWWSRIRGNSSLETWSKPLTTVLVIGIALVSGAPTDQIVVAVIALTLCLLGDIFLMSVVDKFVLGLASFLLGHVVFIVLFVKYGLQSSALAGLALIVAALLGASVGRVIVQGAEFADRTLQKPVLAYLVVIMAMAVRVVHHHAVGHRRHDVVRHLRQHPGLAPVRRTEEVDVAGGDDHLPRCHRRARPQPVVTGADRLAGMPGNPLSDPNWAPDVVDLIDKYVGKVRLTATDNAVKASRAVVFGVLVVMAVMVATPLIVIISLGVLRELLGFFVDHDTAVYLVVLHPRRASS